MRQYRIAVVPGDGIGKEVVPEGLRLLATADPDLAVTHEHLDRYRRSSILDAAVQALFRTILLFSVVLLLVGWLGTEPTGQAPPGAAASRNPPVFLP